MSTFDPSGVLARLDAATAFVRNLSTLAPRLAVVAGSGLGALGDLVEGSVRIPYAEIPHMPAPKVEGHSGELVLGHLEGLPIAVLSGRVHAYEGHPLNDVVFGVRLVARLGAPRFLLTNAAGGIHRWLEPGSLCRIVDHINLTGMNALIGPNIDALGTRFPDMTFGYGGELGDLVQSAAADAGVSMFCGVYAGVSGPSYETPAEVRMLRMLGAAVVGMSTVHECIALNHMGVEVAGLSVVTNFAAGVLSEPLEHAHVKLVAAKAGPNLLAVTRGLARKLAAADAKG